MNQAAPHRAPFHGMGRRKRDNAQTNWWARACAALVLSAATAIALPAQTTFTTLHSFDYADGTYSYASLVQALSGNFYGTTSWGGAHGYGTVFSLSVDLGPFVETEPTSGPVGTTVRILGTNLSPEFAVTFNGTRARITAVSPSEITTIVPPGATTGEVKVGVPVLLPGSRVLLAPPVLSSNVPFRVP